MRYATRSVASGESTWLANEAEVLIGFRTRSFDAVHASRDSREVCACMVSLRAEMDCSAVRKWPGDLPMAAKHVSNA